MCAYDTDGRSIHERTCRLGQLDVALLHLLADIMFAADEIRDMVAMEPGLPPFDGFVEAIARIHTEARTVIGTLEGTAMSSSEDRDPELRDVLTELARRLAAIEPIKDREHDDARVLVEAYTAPFVYEVLP